MVLIKLSATVSRISGKLGGSIFQFAKYGQVVKQNAFSLPQFSTRQTAQRMKATIIPTLWSQLTLPEKNDWKDLTSLYPYVNKVGETSIYSGYALFLLLNQNLFFANLPITLQAPGKLSGRTFGIMTILSISSTTLNFRYEARSGLRLQFFGTIGMQAGKVPRASEFKLYASQSTTGVITDFDMFTQFVSSNGTIVAGLQYSFLFKEISPATGQVYAISDTFTSLAV